MTAESCHCERSKSSEAIPNNEIASSSRHNIGLPRNDIITKIRAHHLLCMQGFQGYGYSQDFVANMTQVIKDINSSPDLELEITAECDVICSHCPYNKKEVCEKNPDSVEKLSNMDKRVIKKLGLREGSKVKAKDILSLLKTKLRGPGIKDICGDCGWKEKCFLVNSL